MSRRKQPEAGRRREAPKASPGKEVQSAEQHPRRDRILDFTEAGLWIGLLVFGSFVALAALRQEVGPPKHIVAPSGVVEAENMQVAGTSRNFTFWLQPTNGFLGGRWSKDGHMFAYGTQKGDWIDLEMPRTEPGKYRLELFLTKAADYGIVAASVNGLRVGGEVDLWSDFGVVPTGPLDLGIVELGEGKDVMRIEIAGANPGSSAPFFQFGVDGIRLTKQ